MGNRTSSTKSVIRSTGRRLLFPGVEAGWSLAFKVAGALWRPKLRLIAPTGYDKVLVVAPHPDDETIGCGGTIALHSMCGDQVCVCIATDGGNSRAAGLSRHELSQKRREEATRACSILGNVELLQLGLPEGRWHDHQLARFLDSLVEDRKPTIIYSPSVIDYHPEHIRVARVFAEILRQKRPAIEAHIRVYEVQVPLTPLLANAVTDISQSTGLKDMALNSYQTQRQGLVWLPRSERYRKELYRLPGPNEVFRDMSPQAFSVMMQGTDSGRVKYFGIRPRPFTDGAAWLVGMAERARLRRLLKEH